jgi:fructokinase
MTNVSDTNLTFDLFALGEALVDLISVKEVETIKEASTFKRYKGGQPANLAANMALFGKRSAVAACIGDDGFGHFIYDQLGACNVATDFIQFTSQASTSMALITRHARTADFMISRGADAYLKATSSIEKAASNSRIVHTSAFGLSRDPARTTILGALQIAHEAGRIVSLDPNYHPKIWPDVGDFLPLLKMAYQYVSITKPSLDDCVRLFGPGKDPIDYARFFLDWGCQTVALTMGERGIILAMASGSLYHIKSNGIPVADATGAGDAFWAGFLNALLDGVSVVEAAKIGQVVAEVKLGRVGPMTMLPNHEELLRRSKAIPCTEIRDRG